MALVSHPLIASDYIWGSCLVALLEDPFDEDQVVH